MLINLITLIQDTYTIKTFKVNTFPAINVRVSYPNKRIVWFEIAKSIKHKLWKLVFICISVVKDILRSFYFKHEHYTQKCQLATVHCDSLCFQPWQKSDISKVFNSNEIHALNTDLKSFDTDFSEQFMFLHIN